MTQLEQVIGGLLMYRSSQNIKLTILGQMYITKFTSLVVEFIETIEYLDDYKNYLELLESLHQ